MQKVKRIDRIIKRAKELGIYDTLCHNARIPDMGGVAYIINLCENNPGSAAVKNGLIFDVMDVVKGEKS